ncbi:MAG: hypothetical protein WDZ88_04280 [Candidatus Paceibacterota bacterium]
MAKTAKAAKKVRGPATVAQILGWGSQNPPTMTTASDPYPRRIDFRHLDVLVQHSQIEKPS